MARRNIDTSTTTKTQVRHRIATGLVALSLSLTSLALGTALFLSPGAAYIILPTNVKQAVAPSTATAVTLTWTAPSDNGPSGQAAAYDIRYSAAPITADNFSTATAVTNPPIPQPAGSTETYSVTNLDPGTTYFFALKSVDESNNWSALSNVVSKTTTALAVACTPTYTCSDWSTCNDNQQRRTCSVNNGCNSELDQPITEQQCSGEPAAGGVESHIERDIIVAGLAAGNAPLVRIVDAVSHKLIKQLMVFEKSDRHGVNVAAGNVTGENKASVIVGSGSGRVAQVKIYDIAGTLLTSFSPYPASGKVGVAVAAGDVDGDGTDEILTTPAGVAGQLRVYRYSSATKKVSLLSQIKINDKSSGFTVAAGDMNRDGLAEMVVAPRSNGRYVYVFQLVNNNLKQIRRITAYPRSFSSGLMLTMGDVYGDGRKMIIVAPGTGYYSQVRIYDYSGRLMDRFVVIGKSYIGGLTMTSFDLTHDGRDELLTGYYRSGAPRVFVYRYNSLTHLFSRTQSFLVFPSIYNKGLRLGGI